MHHKTALVRRAALLAAVSGVTLAMQGAPASADTQDEPIEHCQTKSGDASDLSPSTQKAWADFICGGAHLTGGAARMVSGAWIGAPGTVIAGATGEELTETQMDAWKNWDRGANQAGKGAAMIVSGVYVGAPGYIIDKLSNSAGGVAPSDLSRAEMDQVSFLIPADSPFADNVELDALPTDALPTDGLPTDQLPTDQLPTDQLPTDQLPTDQLPTDQLPTDQLPTDQLPTDQLPTDQLPTDQLPT
ncbi:MAG: hypothetical protein ACRDO7_16490, partial [Nocardioidaceae bacterium]